MVCDLDFLDKVVETLLRFKALPLLTSPTLSGELRDKDRDNDDEGSWS